MTHDTHRELGHAWVSLNSAEDTAIRRPRTQELIDKIAGARALIEQSG